MANSPTTTPVPKDAREFLSCVGLALRLGGKVIFSGTNWVWRKGEQWGMLGPDGSGKSLLIRAILGQVPLVRGEVRGPYGEPESPELAPEEAIAVVSARRGNRRQF